MSFSIEFGLVGLPKLANQLLRGHWRVKASHAKLWKRRVWRACWHLRPEAPLAIANVFLTRASSAEPDYDGLVSSFKPILDGLVEAKVLANDKRSNFKQLAYSWEKCSPGKGHIKVRVEGVESGT